MEAVGVPQLTANARVARGPSVDARAREVLDRVAALARRAAAATEVAVLVRDTTDPSRLIPVAGSAVPGAPLVGRRHTDLEPLAHTATTGSLTAYPDRDGGWRIAAPLAWGGTTRGVLSAKIAAAESGPDRPQLAALDDLARVASIALEDAEARTRLAAALEGGVALLAAAVDIRDLKTGEHSADVETHSLRVGARLGMESHELAELAFAARLHDIGKLAVPDAVLGKPGPLDEDEWRQMRSHAEAGAEMLARVPGLERIAVLVRSHHERWDGRGYPDGLAGSAIPLGSRVIAACDGYCAMTVDRPYRRALSRETALAELRSGAGGQYDPAVVAAFAVGSD